MSSLPPIPYVVGQWVRAERFYGRLTQINEILDGHRNWIWLLGTRRVGKTSLLKQLEHLTASGEQGYLPVFWDFQGADDPQELSLNFNDALLDAEERLDEVGIDLTEVEGDDLFVSMGRLRRSLRAKNRSLLLLCDEVEELINLNQKDPALLRKLRRTMQSQEGIRSVLASTIRLFSLADQREDTSPFLHGFTPPLYIHTLSDDEARDLIRQSHLPPGTRPELDDDMVETIRQRCDNHPYLIQLVCKRYLELQDLDEAFEQVASDRMVSYFFSVDFEMLAGSERKILRLISEETAATSASIRKSMPISTGALSSGLQRLENLGFIRRDQERRFVLASYFFRQWLHDLPRVQLAPTSPIGSDQDQPGRSSETTLAFSPRSETIDSRYRLLEKVGEGASGEVYRASDTLLDTVVAIKILKPGYIAGQEALERVRQEIILSRDIGHPNILRTYHLGEYAGRPYITMQWVDGTTLATIIADQAPLAITTCIDMTGKLASALAAAHQRKILHRDIKPGNILTDRQGEPFLGDFGLARLIGGPGITNHDYFLGTPYYASPEQAELQPLDERSDLYALGLILYEMVTGRRPFEADTGREVLEMQRTIPPPDPRKLIPTLPEGLADLILRCLEKDPAQRFASAETLAAALKELSGGVSDGAG
jgi:hypothetical protein